MQAIILSLLVGAAGVFQGGFNRVIAAKWGLPTAILMSGCFVALFSIVLFAYSFRQQDFTNFKFEWWYLLPAVCGFFLILAMPWCIAQIGATKAFLCILVGQMVISLAWDFFVENIGVDAYRLGGAGLAVAGLILANLKG